MWGDQIDLCQPGSLTSCQVRRVTPQRLLYEQSRTAGRVRCSSSTMQSKISLNVRNEKEKKRRLWFWDVIIMHGCRGHECCWPPSVRPQCQSFRDRHCHKAETSSRSDGPNQGFIYVLSHVLQIICPAFKFFLLSWFLILPSWLPLALYSQRRIKKSLYKDRICFNWKICRTKFLNIMLCAFQSGSPYCNFSSFLRPFLLLFCV